MWDLGRHWWSKVERCQKWKYYISDSVMGFPPSPPWLVPTIFTDNKSHVYYYLLGTLKVSSFDKQHLEKWTVPIDLIHAFPGCLIPIMPYPDLDLDKLEGTNLVFLPHCGGPHLHATCDFPVLPSWYGGTRVAQSFWAANESVIKKEGCRFPWFSLSHSFPC